MEGTTPFPTPLFGLHFPRGRECLISGNGDERVQRRVVPFDAVQAGSREVDGGYAFTSKQV